MTTKKHLLIRNVVALLAATPLLWIAPPVYPQSAPTQDNRPAQDNDITRQELARFDQFLDSDREIAEQLRKNPSLVNDSTFLQQHQALQTFLQQHPAVREELQENPSAFLRREERYDRRENTRDSDVTRQELAQFDRFLDGHRETAEQLRNNPWLVNDRQFVDKHPELQTYLQQHPGVREELKENPNAFMREEQRFDNRQDAGDRRDDDRNEGRNDDRDRFDNRDHSRDIDARTRDNDMRDHDTTRGELASFDQFLDKHREIAEQLRKNPGLVNNQQFLDNHPALQTYLGTHKGVREEITENPQAFMRRENRFDNRQDANRDEAQNRRDNDRNNDAARNDDRAIARNDDRDKNRDLDARSRDNDRANDRARDNDRHDHDTTRGELASFDQFLDKHRETAEQLRKNPALVNNRQFLANHPALQAYLSEHKGVREEIDENPQAFMHQEASYDRHENGMGRSNMDRERASFAAFLSSHSTLSEQLSKNPSLVKNQEFMATHTELQDYLKAHPAAQAQLTQNPDSFIKSSQQFSATTKSSTSTTGSVKTTPPDATKPPKQ